MDKIFKATEILLPNESVDMSLWPSLACDQFTSQPEYWQKAEELCKDKISSLHITLPEVYLEGKDTKQRIEKIHETMADYLNSVLTQKINGFVYTERYFEGKQEPLCGIVGAVDLEAYSYDKGQLPQIRPSENTVVERIPPRLEVRRCAPLETPHILMLLDDSENTVVEKIATKKQSFKKLYETNLMLGGGNAIGFAITDSEIIAEIETAVANLGTSQAFDAKYPQAKGNKPLTMAVGDGNHSLATAKAHWNEVKKTLSPEEQETHPARYCLVELVNVHSNAIEIEPIHRVVFGAEMGNFKSEFMAWLSQKGAEICENANNAQSFVLVANGQKELINVSNAPHPLAVGTIETFIDEFCQNNAGTRVDYIHGEDAVLELSSQNATGILLPDFAKSDLFRGVVLGGVLPRKTFSMGHAEEKRYYLECRKITK